MITYSPEHPGVADWTWATTRWIKKGKLKVITSIENARLQLLVLIQGFKTFLFNHTLQRLFKFILTAHKCTTLWTQCLLTWTLSSMCCKIIKSFKDTSPRPMVINLSETWNTVLCLRQQVARHVISCLTVRFRNILQLKWQIKSNSVKQTTQSIWMFLSFEKVCPDTDFQVWVIPLLIKNSVS